MPCEYYEVDWLKTELHMMPRPELIQSMLDEENAPLAPWAVHSCLGDDNKIWCQVYRAPDKSGGFFCIKDFTETLLVAYASSNMAFLQALQHFSHMVSNSRYAADIFENADEYDDGNG